MQPAVKAVAWGALIAALAACAPGGGIGPAAGGSAPPTTTTAPAPEQEGPIVVGLGGFASPRTLNPLLDGPDTGVLDVIGAAVFAAGYSVDPRSGGLLPAVLAEIPSVENGGVVVGGDGTLAVTYRVSPTARWSDGEPITAEDLRFTWEVVGDASLPIRRDVRARYAAVVAGSVAADGLTLRLRMERGGDPALLFGIILPSHQVAGTDFVADWNDRMWAAGGPFAFVSWVPGQYLMVRRNPHYAARPAAGGSPPARPEEVAYRFFPEADGAALQEAFAARLIAAAVLPAGTDLAPYEALTRDGAVLEAAPSASWQALVFQFGPANRNEASLNGEARFREAVARALDRTALAEALGTEALVSIYAGCHPGLAGGAWGALGPDLDGVRALLDAVGRDLGLDLFAGEGPRLVLTVSGGDGAAVTTAEAVGGMLRAAGIAAEVQVEDPSVFYGDTLVDGTWDVAVLTFACRPGLAPAADLARWFDPGAPLWRGGSACRWGTIGSGTEKDPAALAYAALIAELAGTVGDDAAAGLLRRAESILADAVVLVPLAPVGRWGVAYWADAVPEAGVGPAGVLTGVLAGGGD